MSARWGETTVSRTLDSPSRVRPPSRGEAALAGLVAWLISLALLGPCLRGRFFCDDWEFVLEDPCRLVGPGAFLEPRPYTMYRPLQLLATAASQCWFGSATMPVHVLTTFVHAWTCALVWRIVRDGGEGRLAAGLAVAFLATSQFSIMAVASNDTLSLVLATWAGALGYRVLSRVEWHPARALGILGVALIAKESALGYAAALAVWGAWRTLASRTRAYGWQLAAGSVGMAIIYLAWRGHVTGWTPGLDPNPGFRFGPNLATNFGMLLGPLFLPVSTTWTFLSVQAGHRGLPALAMLVSLAGWLLVLGTAVRHIGAARVAALLILAIAGMLPVLALPRVSELYAYAALPGVAVLFGIAARGWLTGSRWRGMAALAIFAWLAGQALVSHEKAVQMHANGESAAELARGVRAVAPDWPQGSKIVMVDDIEPRTQYSMFVMAGVRLVGPLEIGRVTGRQDVLAVHAPVSCVVGNDTAVVLLSYSGNRVGSRTLTAASPITLSLAELRALALAR